MKTISKLTIGVYVLFFSLSCTKSVESVEGDSTLSVNSISAKFKAISTLDKKEDRKIAFKLLSSFEKISIWKMHFSVCIKNLELSKIQKSLIKEAEQFLTVNNFTITNNINSNPNFEIWKYKVAKEFSIELRDQIFNDLKLNNINMVTAAEPSSSVPVGGGCECNTDSDFCSRMNTTTPTGCTSAHYCKASGCTTSTSGCGWLWSQDCNGDCKLVMTGNC